MKCNKLASPKILILLIGFSLFGFTCENKRLAVFRYDLSNCPDSSFSFPNERSGPNVSIFARKDIDALLNDCFDLIPFFISYSGDDIKSSSDDGPFKHYTAVDIYKDESKIKNINRCELIIVHQLPVRRDIEKEINMRRAHAAEVAKLLLSPKTKAALKSVIYLNKYLEDKKMDMDTWCKQYPKSLKGMK